MNIEERRLNADDASQGPFKRVLCVCHGGINRSATLAWLLSQPPYNFNTRAAGVGDEALIKIDPILIYWADEIICAERSIELDMRDWFIVTKPVTCLNIPDDFDYREAKLIDLIKKQYPPTTKETKRVP